MKVYTWYDSLLLSVFFMWPVSVQVEDATDNFYYNDICKLAHIVLVTHRFKFHLIHEIKNGRIHTVAMTIATKK